MKSIVFYLKLFVVLGVLHVGALLFGLCIFPLIPGSTRQVRQRRRRLIAGAVIAFYLRLLSILKLLKITVLKRDLLPKMSTILVANHPTLFDALILLTLIPDSICIAKGALRRHPAFALPIFWLGYITAQRGKSLIEIGGAALAAGSSLIIFPEGTRSTHFTSIDPFQRGAASCALRCAATITPVVLSATSRVLGRKAGIFSISPGCYEVAVTIKPSIAAPPRPALELLPGAARDLTSELELLFKTWLSKR